MTKIAYLRKLAAKKYTANDLAAAMETGEVLLREHWHIQNFRTRGYANDLFNLACVHERLGNPERAAALFSDSAAQISMLEGESLAFAERVNSLATVLIQMGLLEPAFYMLGNVAAIRRNHLGEHSPLYADSIYNLANAASEIGRKKDSLKYHLEALQIRQNEGHIDDIIHSLHSIAFIHESARDYEKAAEYAEEALENSFGDAEKYLVACNYLADLYEKSKKFDSALIMYEKVMHSINSDVGREHSAYLNTARRRANLLSMMNRPSEALAAYEEVLKAFAKKCGTNHIFYANGLRGVASLHKILGNPAQAEAAILDAMKISRTFSEDIILDVTFLIRLHLLEENPEKALEALVYALMCSDTSAENYSARLETIVAAFSQTHATAEFIKSMEVLNDKEKLRPILKKWAEWEARS